MWVTWGGQTDWWWATLHSYFYLYYIKYLRVLSISTNSLVVNCFIIVQQSLSITCGGESGNHLLLSVKQQVISSGRTAVTTITQHQQWKPTMAGTLISWQMPPLSFASADQRYPVRSLALDFFSLNMERFRNQFCLFPFLWKSCS